MNDEKKNVHDEKLDQEDDESISGLVNTSGHVQELDRTFGFWSGCASAVLADNAWGAGGGALVVALYNGGGPGVMYGLIASVLFYIPIGLSLAELASAMPTSANVYHWARVTAGPKYGRICSWYAGYWNTLAWIFGSANGSLYAAQTIIALYSLYHPEYVPQRWHSFVVLVVVTWASLALLMFGQQILARTVTTMGVFLFVLFLVTTLMLAIYPSQTETGYASNQFVWVEWQNLTGWSSDGLVFLMGILNGAFAIGTPDAVCHLCEEIPNPRRNVPYGILFQLATGAASTFLFYVALLYGVTDLNAIFNSPFSVLPLAAMFQQAVQSTGATAALLVLFFLDQLINIPGVYLAAGRMLWTIARDDATPFSSHVRHVSVRWRNPFKAQLVCGVCATALGAVYVGSATAFTTFVGSFTILTTWSYLAAILPHMLTRRRYVKPGPFWMPDWVAYPVMGLASAYIIVFNVIYMFPYTYPVSVNNMNWASVMTGGLTIVLTFWYLWKRTHGYDGPNVFLDARDDILEGIVGLSAVEEERLRKRV